MHPYLLHFGHLYLPTFGVLTAFGAMLALALSLRTASLVGLDAEKLWDAGLFAFVAAFVLSRLLLIFTHLRSFLAFPLLLLAVPSLTATGLLLTAVATVLWLRFRHMPLLAALDAWAPCAALVWAALALGHLAEASDPGLPTSLPWGLRIQGQSMVSLQPVALYVFVVASALSASAYARLRFRPVQGEVAAIALLLAGLAQFLLSFLRQPGDRAFGGLDALQWLALGLVLAGGGLLAMSVRARRRQTR